jgi:hypothetical protein
MKKTFIIMLTIGLIYKSYSQIQPYLLIDNVNTQFNSVSLPYWLKEGQTIGLGSNSKSLSVLEFNINGTNLEFSRVLSVTSTLTVPTNKVWKIEGIGLLESNNVSIVNFSNNSSTSTTNPLNLPTIYQSPAKYNSIGVYNWKVPPGVTSICVEVWGGGGKGGNGFSAPSPSNRGGGGGGGGGYGYQCFSVIPGSNYLVTVGGDSSFGNLISATGGGNGGNATSTLPGVGGIGGVSSASFNISGSNGTSGSFGLDGGQGGQGGIGINGAYQNNGGLGGCGCSPNNGSNGNIGQVIIYW